MQDSAVARNIIVEILTQGSPESGARLKQRLNIRLKDLGLEHFDESKLGFKRFRDYLERGLSDVVKVTPAEGLGDIGVRLIGQESSVNGSVESGVEDQTLDISLLRDDVRLAFTNPDPTRKRFFNKKSNILKHFSVDGESSEKKEVSNNSEEYIEIIPASPDVQKLWMSWFLDKYKQYVGNFEALENIVRKNYHSALNAEFGKALGELSGEWKRYRNSNVAKEIESWCKENKINVECLFKSTINPGSALKSVAFVEGGAPDAFVVRQKAVKLLELLSDDDIARFVIPTLMGVIMVKSHK